MEQQLQFSECACFMLFATGELEGSVYNIHRAMTVLEGKVEESLNSAQAGSFNNAIQDHVQREISD
jgi:hypothetical protein